MSTKLEEGPLTPAIYDNIGSQAEITKKALQISKLDKDQDIAAQALEIIDSFGREAALGNLSIIKNISQAIDARITSIDNLLSTQINEIIHHPEFQKLESSWYGIKNLIDFSEPDDELLIKILDATKEDILSDTDSAPDFDQTELFKKIYEHEFGTLGGTPFGAMIGDYYFSRTPEDMDCLKAIALVAAAAHCPFITGTSPDMFNLEDFRDISKPRDLVKMFSSPEFMSWRRFRTNEDLRYVSLTLPRVIIRNGYGKGGIPVREFQFKEKIDGNVHENFLWGNCAFSLGERILDSYRKYGWFSNIRGMENGGVVESLPYFPYTDLNGDETFKMPIEAQITDRREKELDDLGFLPIVYKRGSDHGVFFGSKVLLNVTEFADPVASANAKLGVELPYIMALARFAHFIKIMVRQKIGSFATLASMQSYLSNWIARYVIANDDASTFDKSRFPLREAKVTVKEIPGKVGVYHAVMELRPHFYLNELTVALRLVTEIGEEEGGDEGGDEA